MPPLRVLLKKLLAVQPTSWKGTLTLAFISAIIVDLYHVVRNRAPSFLVSTLRALQRWTLACSTYELLVATTGLVALGPVLIYVHHVVTTRRRRKKNLQPMEYPAVLTLSVLLSTVGLIWVAFMWVVNTPDTMVVFTYGSKRTSGVDRRMLSAVSQYFNDQAVREHIVHIDSLLLDHDHDDADRQLNRILDSHLSWRDKQVVLVLTTPGLGQINKANLLARSDALHLVCISAICDFYETNTFRVGVDRDAQAEALATWASSQTPPPAFEAVFDASDPMSAAAENVFRSWLEDEGLRFKIVSMSSLHGADAKELAQQHARAGILLLWADGGTVDRVLRELRGIDFKGTLAAPAEAISVGLVRNARNSGIRMLFASVKTTGDFRKAVRDLTPDALFPSNKGLLAHAAADAAVRSNCGEVLADRLAISASPYPLRVRQHHHPSASTRPSLHLMLADAVQIKHVAP